MTLDATNKKILIFTATYNEAGNISEFINSIFNNNNHIDLLIIDDNSPDNTANIIKELKKNLAKLT